MDDLPSDLLIEIVSHVSVSDIPTVARVNKKWHEAAIAERIWMRWCQRDGFYLQPEDGSSWRSCYRRHSGLRWDIQMSASEPGTISADGRTIVANQDGNLVALANWKLGPESIACWELNLSWADPEWDRIVGLADPRVEIDYIGFDEYGWGIMSSGDAVQHKRHSFSFRGSDYQEGGTVLLLFHKGTLHMWLGETYVGEAFKDIFGNIGNEYDIRPAVYLYVIGDTATITAKNSRLALKKLTEEQDKRPN